MNTRHVPYRDPSIASSDRVEDLIGRMTIAEKIAQLGCVWSIALVEDGHFSETRASEALRNGIGQVTRIGATTGLRPSESAAFMNEIQAYLMNETRLGIPALVHEESTAGFTARDADQFPQAIGLASTWNPELIERAAGVIREQMVAVGARLTLAPVLDIAREPRWGRLEETYGEDPYLASRIGVAYVRGIQGEDLRNGVAATGKHFLGYGVSEGGHNHKPAHIPARQLREVYARPFLAAIQEAGIASIMNAYNEIDGLPCGGSKEILDDLLRGELGFEGVVVADYFTTMLLMSAHRVAENKEDAGQMALEAGLDVELPALDCYAGLGQRVEDGVLAMEIVDRSLRRHLRLKFDLGLFDEPMVDAAAAPRFYQTAKSRNIARQLANESIVLLRNQDATLPLDPNTSRIAVLGPCSDDVRLLQGDYHYPAHAEIVYLSSRDDAGEILPRGEASSLEPGPFYPPTVTPLAGIRAVVAKASEVRHARGCDISGDDASGIGEAVELARDSDVALVFVGGKSGLMPDCTSGEFRDASDLNLTGQQERLVRDVAATGTTLVVVLINGRALGLPWMEDLAAGIVEAWIPGEEGGQAIADVLFGNVNPSGRLPVSLARHVGQLPLYYSRRWSTASATMLAFSPDYSDGPAAPLYPFGHGLSYTTFEYSDLAISNARPAPDEVVEISLRVTNTGDRAGDEVVQLYAQDPVASVTRPIQLLVGFTRVHLEPAGSANVHFELDSSQLAFYDRTMRFVVEPGEIKIRVGASSDDIRAEGSFEYAGNVLERSPREIRPTRVRIQ